MELLVAGLDGDRIVAALLDIEGVRVVYKPHPATGSQDAAYARADSAVREQLHAAGAPHEVMTGVSGLYAAFNAADMLISDVSSVVTDFLSARKPYAVTNPHGLDDDEFRTEYPSAAAAALVRPDTIDTLAAIVEDARGVDRLAAERNEVATYLLGPDRSDPLAGFADALDAAIAVDTSAPTGQAGTSTRRAPTAQSEEDVDDDRPQRRPRRGVRALAARRRRRPARLITSANVACGFHAGDPLTLRTVCAAAVERRRVDRRPGVLPRPRRASAAASSTSTPTS